MTDEEDNGDYDNVIAYIPTSDDQPGSPRTSRSRQNSYADLQRLRMTGQSNNPSSMLAPSTDTPSPSTAPMGTEGLHHRRERRQSLTAGVSVERIAALEGGEPFDDATKDINEEIRQGKSDRGQDD